MVVYKMRNPEVRSVSSVAKAPPPAKSSAFTIADVLNSALRNKYLILMMTLLGLAAAFAVATRLTKHYTTDSALIWDTSMSAITDGDTGAATAMIDPSATTTIVETLSTPAVVENAVATLPPAIYQQLLEELGIGEFVAKNEHPGDAELKKPLMVDYVLRNASIYNSGRSYVIRIYYKSTDPETAAVVANAIAQAYLAYRIELKRAAYKSMLSSLDSQILDLKAKLDTADVQAQTKREETRLLTERSEGLTGGQREQAIADSAAIFAGLREAEREADATGLIYERLLRNQRELQSRIQTPELDVHLFAPAITPLEPSGFNAKPVLILLGAGSGFLFGLELGLLRDRLRGRRLKEA